jgi:hypothetical protein
MLKQAFLFVCFTFLLAAAREAAQPAVVFPGRNGLVLIAMANDGFALAADGSSSNADGTVSEARKIFPVGRHGAIALAGKVSIQDPLNRPFREEVNITRIAEAWLNAHPDVDVAAANREINALVAAALNKFFATRNPGADAGAYKFVVIVAGDAAGKPALTVTRYFVPKAKGQVARAEQTSSVAMPGRVLVFGSTRFYTELIAGKSDALKVFKAEPAVRQFRSLRTSETSAQEYADLFDTILHAAESDEGKKFDSGRSIVAPPNRIATVTTKDGFAWKGTGPAGGH